MLKLLELNSAYKLLFIVLGVIIVLVFRNIYSIGLLMLIAIFLLSRKYGINVNKIMEKRKLDEDNRFEYQQDDERFSFLADSIPHKIWTTTAEGDITYVNKQWLEYTGEKSLEEFKAHLADIFHPDDREKIQQIWNEVNETGENKEIDCRLRNNKGEYRWHHGSFTAQRDANQNIVMWVSSCTDIHEQKNISDALKISEAHFRELANQNSIIIWKADAYGNTTYINKTWEKYTGMNITKGVEGGWPEAIHPDDREMAVQKFKTNFELRKPFKSKYRLKKTDGTYRWFLNMGNPIMDPDFVGYIGSITDIHEQELKKQSMQALMQQKDEFLSIASHELKTPITSMKASLQFIERIAAKDQEMKEVQMHVSRASKQIDRLTGLVDDLLDVTKIQAGKMQLHITDFSIEGLLKDVIQGFQSTSPSHKITLRGDPDVSVKGDKFRIEQVLNNLLSNAIKYSPDANEIIVTVQIKDYMLHLSVTDFGIGIPKEKESQIFSRFYRVQESSHKFSGLGLGLFISKEIIERHSGTMGVNSEEGKGSTFWFTLPLDKQLGLAL